jgi:glutamine synthetase
MDEPTIEEWMDRHHVEIVRTHATTLEGAAVGKYLNRPKFLKSIPDGHNIADMALAMDITGSPHMSFWHDFRHGQFGDILMRPDIDSIVSDGTDPDLGHCLCDFTDVDGKEISLCPRTLLKKITGEIDELGYNVKAAFELEFFIFRNTFDQARRREYKNLDPVTASTSSNIYLLRNAHNAKPFMDEVLKRLNWQRFPWESWSDEGGVGQVELNFSPTDPVKAADTIVRAKQLIYEVAVDLGMSVTFMASIRPGYGNGLHVHHSLQKKNGTSAFREDGEKTPLLKNWIAGITSTMAGATSMLCPTFNAYRRLTEFTSPPVTATWGEESKTAGLRVISRTDDLARIEHRLPGGDANPYLVLAAILGGGLAGARKNLAPPEELKFVGWGLPEDVPRLPNSIMGAADALAADALLGETLGQDVVDYWINTRKLEWLSFHSECGDIEAKTSTQWEYNRYFELL